MLHELRKALGKCQRDHAAVGRTDNRGKRSSRQMFVDPSQDLCLVVSADRGEVGLSGPRSGGLAAAAEEVDAEHLVAICVERLALTDHFCPPALLAGPDICHDAAG